MSTWAKMQQTIDELRAELNSVQATTAKLDAVVAERAEKVRKYTSANGAVELNCATGEFKLSAPDEALKPTGKPRLITAGQLSDTCGQLDCDLKTGVFTVRSPSGAVSWGDLEKGELTGRIDSEPDTESLDLGGITLYGDLAAKVREVQAILAAHGAGELKLVKPRPEEGKDYLVVDGQIFVNRNSVKSVEWLTQITEQGKRVAAGIGVGAEVQSFDDLLNAVAASIESIKLEITDPVEQIRQVIRDELKPGGMLHRG